jgi:hypothetical protein
MVSKLQDVIAELTSFRQYSPAAAGVDADAKPRNPSVSIAVAGAAVIFKNCLISLSLCLNYVSGGLISAAFEMGHDHVARHACMADTLSDPLLVRARR